MSFRGRPSLSGTPGRSTLETSPSKVDLSQLRDILQTARDLPCFQVVGAALACILCTCCFMNAQTHPECQGMIDDVLTKCLPVAAAASKSERTGPSGAGGYSPPVAPNFPYLSVDGAEYGVDLNRKQHEVGLFSPSSVLPTPRKGDGGVLLTPNRESLLGRKASGSGFVEKMGITRIPDRAWTIALDYLDLGEGMRCRQLGRLFRNIVESSLSVLALSGVKSITWATPENLSFLTRFKNVRTLHWYVGVGRPTEPEDEDDAAGIRAADGPTDAGANGGGAASSAGEGSGRVDRGKYLSVAECNPVRAWAYLLGALPKIEEVIIVEGLETDEPALEEVWLHLLPLCRNLRSFFLNFEDYSECPVDGDHPPINVKKFAVFLQAKRPFPKLRELHLELGSMSIAEQRSLIRGLSMSGLLPQLEKVTLGDGTTSYIRNPGRGPGRDLYTAFKKNPCARLKVLWLQRLDLWDDLEALAVALSPEYCPVLEELFLDLALDTDDVVRLAKCLHKFPDCLKTLGVLAVAIKDRTTEGNFTNNDPTPALQMLADALANHPRPYLQCLDISLHFELPQPEPEDLQRPLAQMPFEARTSVAPIMLLIESGKLTGLKHVQLSGCSLDDGGLLVACKAVASVKGIQTLDLSSNRLSKEGAKQLAKALWRCRRLHEIVLEESVEEKDSEEVSQVFKEYMPWATIRLDDRDSRRSFARRAAASHGHFDDDTDDQDGFMDDDDNDDSQATDQGHPHHWDAIDAESDGEVPPELMTDDSDEEM